MYNMRLPVEQDGPCPRKDVALCRVEGGSATQSEDAVTAAGSTAPTTTGRTCGGSPREVRTCSEGCSSGCEPAETASPRRHKVMKSQEQVSNKTVGLCCVIQGVRKVCTQPHNC